MIDMTALQDVLNQLYNDKIADTLNQRTVLLSKLNKTLGGGKNMAWDVKVARGTSAGSYASGANITGDDNDTEVPAVLQWKRYKSEFKVSGDALAAAATSGPAAYANLFGKQIMDAARNLAKDLGAQVYGDGTGNGGLDMDGLGAFMSATGTYAGLSRVTYATWQANVLANGGVNRALTVDLLRQMERTCYTASGFSPDFIITTPAIYDKYAALFDSIKRVMADSMTFDLGTSQLAFQGIPILRDVHCPANTLYMLSKDSIEFQQLPFVRSADGQQLTDGEENLNNDDGDLGLQVGIELLGKSGDAYKGFVKLYGNMKCENPNHNGVIEDITE